MSKGGSKAPQAPDPAVVARAQGGENRNAALYNALLNRVNTYSPLGSQEFTQTGTDPTTGAPITRQDIRLDPQTEALFRQQQGQSQRFGETSDRMLGQLPSQPFSFSGLPEVSQDFDGLRKSQSDALYGRNTAYLDPQYKQGEDALRSRMANQGIVEGSEAYTNAMGDFNRGKEFSYGQARDSAIAGGGAEADRQYGMQADRRRQAMTEALTARNQPFNELSAIRGMTSPAEIPQFQGMANVGVAPTDIAGLTQNRYQGDIDIYNAQQGGRNSMMGGLFNLGSAFLMSDERVKDDIEQVGALNDGTNVYSFKYKGDDTPQVGFMAQEVEKRDPGAVKEIGGIKHVNYRRVLEQALRAA